MNSTNSSIDVNEVRRALALMIEPGQVVEVRLIDAVRYDKDRPHIASGFFTDVDKLIEHLKQAGKTKGTYITLNPVNKDLIALAHNRINHDRGLKTTTDDDVTSRRWLLIDADPERTPKTVSSTDSEHASAMARAQEIRMYLRETGWPEPIYADSGNGGHLLYRIDLPAKDNGLVEKVLKGLAHKFDDDKVKIDTGVFNPARISKLYGTWVRKGDHCPEIGRIHRMARLLHVPDTLTTVSQNFLEAMAATVQVEPEPEQTKKEPHKNASQQKPRGEQFTLKGFLAKYNIGTRWEKEYKGGTKWMLEECPFCREADNSACVYELPDGSLGFSCSHNRCSNLHWKDFRKHFEPDYDEHEYVEYRPRAASSKSNGNGNGHKPSGHDDTDFILDCLGQEEAGDAALFAHLFRGKVVYDTTGSEWYIFNKHRWELDTCNLVKLYVSGELASTYIQTAAVINLQAKNADEEEAAKLKYTIKALTTRALALRKAARINNVLSLVIPQREMHITSDRWDSDVWLLPVANGVVDLHTGQLRDGNPQDYVRTASPTKWEELNTPALRWELALQETFEDREPGERKILIDYLQRALGYGITGLVSEEIFLVLFGEDGRNGKDTIIGGVSNALGSSAGVVSNDVFLSAGRTHTAGAATPHLCDLQGKRIAWANEPENGARFNASQVKDLTGGSKISTRQNYGSQYSFDPTHLLLLLTNHKPHADATDNGFWSRLRMITFNMRFVESPDKPNERKADKNLKKALKDESSGILAWLVRGCLAWQKQGLDAPASVLDDVKAYQKEEDSVARFIEECCVVKPGLIARAGQIYTRYDKWSDDGNMKPMNSTLFGTRISKQFKKGKDRNGGYYEGIGILTGDYDGPGGGVTGSDLCDGSSDNPSQPVTTPVEPNEQGKCDGCDGCDGRIQKVPYEEGSLLENKKFPETAVTPVTKHINTSGLNEPVMPYDGSVTGLMQPVTQPVTLQAGQYVATPDRRTGKVVSVSDVAVVVEIFGRRETFTGIQMDTLRPQSR